MTQLSVSPVWTVYGSLTTRCPPSVGWASKRIVREPASSAGAIANRVTCFAGANPKGKQHGKGTHGYRLRRDLFEP